MSSMLYLSWTIAAFFAPQYRLIKICLSAKMCLLLFDLRCLGYPERLRIRTLELSDRSDQVCHLSDPQRWQAPERKPLLFFFSGKLSFTPYVTLVWRRARRSPLQKLRTVSLQVAPCDDKEG